MIVNKVRNVSEALELGLSLVLSHGQRAESRNGSVLRIPEPVTTVYERPWERVLVNSQRNANPFFHLFESLWMLGGRNDVEYVARYVKRMRQFSDDGETLHGAYGWRWRGGLGQDQVEAVIDLLGNDPTSRRAVMAMFDVTEDTAELRFSRDIPCNTHIYFDTSRLGPGYRLNMTVCCRSNDIVWGAFGANAVHMSILQEYVAARLGMPLGVYRQMSNDLHLYTDVVSTEHARRIVDACNQEDIYTSARSAPPRLVSLNSGVVEDRSFATVFMKDVGRVLATAADKSVNCEDFETLFFRAVAGPMHNAWTEYRKGHLDRAMREALSILADDWRAACLQWLGNRSKQEIAP